MSIVEELFGTPPKGFATGEALRGITKKESDAAVIRYYQEKQMHDENEKLRKELAERVTECNRLKEMIFELALFNDDIPVTPEGFREVVKNYYEKEIKSRKGATEFVPAKKEKDDGV